ncbi:hypothetical protein MRX96_024516 [Rhipicephalus microplus]
MGRSTAFNFSLLDTLLDRVRALGLKPGLELMGNPFPRPLDFEKHADLELWKELVTALARHYLDRYDEDYVAQWNFESWNEPDHKSYGNNFTEQGLCNYYDACSEGLNDASPLLRLGGPAENLAPSHHSPLAWALLEHCESGVRLDFISVHQKGNASTADIVQAEMAAMTNIRERCPGLSTKSCINNEADPIKNWAEPYPWRADATYAAMLARAETMDQQDMLHQQAKRVVQRYNYSVGPRQVTILARAESPPNRKVGKCFSSEQRGFQADVAKVLEEVLTKGWSP